MKEFKCEKCGRIAHSDNNFCQECGGRIIEESNSDRICLKCGSSINTDDLYCPLCGIKLSERNIGYIQKSGNKKIALTVIAIIVVIAIVLISVLIIKRYIFSNSDNIQETQSLTINDEKSIEKQKNDVISDIGETTETDAPVNKTEVKNDEYSDNGSEYIFPSDSTYITNEYLAQKTQSEIRLILMKYMPDTGTLLRQLSMLSILILKNGIFQ